MKKLILILSLITATLLASPAPDLRIVVGGDYGPQLQGLTGRGYLNSFSIFEWPSSAIPNDSGLKNLAVTNAPLNRRLLRFYLDVVNLGDGPLTIGNAFANPARFVVRDGRPHIRGLVEASLIDTNGHIVVERIIEWSPAWDAVTAVPGISKKFGYWSPGISPAAAACGTEPMLDGTLLDVTGLPNGRYTLQVTLDPIRQFGTRDLEQARVEMTINGFDARLWPPPAGARPQETPNRPPSPR